MYLVWQNNKRIWTEDFKVTSGKIALMQKEISAAQGFVRGKGLTVDDIKFREIKGEEYSQKN